MDKIGGDYYDFHTTRDSLGILIADVSGHGIPGAFLASMTNMAFKQNVEKSQNCTELMSALDRILSAKSVKSMFVTATYLHLNLSDMKFECCNRGHCRPLLHRRQTGLVHEIGKKGPPLGIGMDSFGEGTLENQGEELLSGDRFILFTDGIVEAISPDKEEFGEDRLREVIVESSLLNTHDLLNSIVDAHSSFIKGMERCDDMTLVIIDVL